VDLFFVFISSASSIFKLIKSILPSVPKLFQSSPKIGIYWSGRKFAPKRASNSRSLLLAFAYPIKSCEGESESKCIFVINESRKKTHYIRKSALETVKK